MILPLRLNENKELELNRSQQFLNRSQKFVLES